METLRQGLQGSRHASASVLLAGPHHDGCLVVLELVDDAQLESLLLGVGEGLNCKGELLRMGGRIDPALGAIELIHVVVEHEP